MRRRARCSIVPAYLLRAIAANGDQQDRVRALTALAVSSGPRRERQALLELAGAWMFPQRTKRRTIYDAEHLRVLPGRCVRTEGERRTRDAAVDDAYDAAGRTHDFFRRVFGRQSIDDRGMGIRCSVHFGEGFNNAQWDGRQMIYGDGDGKYFNSFTSSLDVTAHELTHGITQYTAALGATGQCGALGEHFSDVFGVLTRQYWLGQSAEQAEWLVGADLFTSRVRGRAIRSMKAPGTAYNDPILGKDPQPGHMRGYVRSSGDGRGVHVNCGIPNHAFYRAAMRIGGNAWEVAGQVWYRVLTRDLGPRSTFQHCADATWRRAGEMFGANGVAQKAVGAAWKQVGIEVHVAMLPVRGPMPRRPSFTPPVAAAEVPVLV
jgi:Zn-dependent metalloprotease